MLDPTATESKTGVEPKSSRLVNFTMQLGLFIDLSTHSTSIFFILILTVLCEIVHTFALFRISHSEGEQKFEKVKDDLNATKNGDWRIPWCLQ